MTFLFLILGALEATIEAHNCSVLCLKFTDDFIVSGSSDGNIKVSILYIAYCKNEYHIIKIYIHVCFIN